MKKSFFFFLLLVFLLFILVLMLPLFDEKETVAPENPSGYLPAGNHSDIATATTTAESLTNLTEGEGFEPSAIIWKTARFSHNENLKEVQHSLLHYLRGSLLEKHGTLFPYPALPKTAFVSPGELAENVCSGKCLIRGWFASGNILYLDNSLKVLSNLEHQSVLLHELVHYYQSLFMTKSSMDTNTADGCKNWQRLEIEAYEIQYAWMEEKHTVKRMPPHRYQVKALGTAPCRKEQ